MSEVRKLKAIRSIVRPDRRDDYLAAWKSYLRELEGLDVQAWLFEDQALPGRYVEFTEFVAGPGMEARLEEAAGRAGLREPCVRRRDEDILYREVKLG